VNGDETEGSKKKEAKKGQKGVESGAVRTHEPCGTTEQIKRNLNVAD
jgi:hypothetical protein